MLWMKCVLGVVRKTLAMGLAGCIMMLVLPMGCGSSIRNAPIRYRQQNQSAEHFLPDITVERFQECLETYGEELGQLEPAFAHAQGYVQVTPEGQIKDVEVTGLPDRARELTACTRVALREMTVPLSVLSLRRKQTQASTDEPTVRRGNELGNPIVLWEIGTLLAEFLAANGGRIVLYTVTIEVLGAGAVEATQLATTKKQRNRDKCRDQYVDCTDSRLAQDLGKHAGDSRCSLCRDICEVQGKWPSWAPVGSCDYKNYRPASN